MNLITIQLTQIVLEGTQQSFSGSTFLLGAWTKQLKPCWYEKLMGRSET